MLMRIKDILPSTQFMVIAGALALSAGLVYTADLLTNNKNESATVAVGSNVPANPDWAKTLEEIQAQSPLNRLPQAPSESSVNNLLNAATSDNVTDTVARTLFIQISSAKAQGLGSDIPTQDALIREAAAKIDQQRGAPVYTQADITVAADTKETMRAYGNGFMSILLRHPQANVNQTLLVIAGAADANDSAKLKALAPIGAEYKALTGELLGLQVPSTLTPLHLSVINNLARMSQTFPDMQVMLTDPLRGLGGLQLYRKLGDESLRVFTSIATTLSKNGILFSKDEPGATWNTLVP